MKYHAIKHQDILQILLREGSYHKSPFRYHGDYIPPMVMLSGSLFLHKQSKKMVVSALFVECEKIVSGSDSK